MFEFCLLVQIDVSGLVGSLNPHKFIIVIFSLSKAQSLVSASFEKIKYISNSLLILAQRVVLSWCREGQKDLSISIVEDVYEQCTWLHLYHGF